MGYGTTINMRQLLIFPSNILIGKTSHINSGCILDGRGGICIGDNVSISFRTNLITGSHRVNSSSFEYFTKKIVIEDNVWIGINSTILPGVVIGKGAIVAACSVVTKDIPPMAIVAGIPAKIIGYRDINTEFSYKCIWTMPFA